MTNVFSSLVQEIDAGGTAVAVHAKVTVFPSSILWFWGLVVICGSSITENVSGKMGYPWEKNPKGFPKIEGNFIYIWKI